MNGLINRSIQCFVRDTYGEERWQRVARELGLGEHGYETLLAYEDDETDRLITFVCAELRRDRQTLLEDLGTYLGSHETTVGIRRLLRFCGETFTDFVHALYDLPSRASLAMPALVLPELEVREDPPGQFRVFVLTDRLGWGDVVLGLLRAMADDYGALVLMERGAGSGPISVIEIKLLDGRFAEGSDFSLGGEAHDPDAKDDTLRKGFSSGEERQAERSAALAKSPVNRRAPRTINPAADNPVVDQEDKA